MYRHKRGSHREPADKTPKPPARSSHPLTSAVDRQKHGALPAPARETLDADLPRDRRRHHTVEGDMLQIIDMGRFVAGDINSNLGHHCNRRGIEPVGLDSGLIHGKMLGLELPYKTFAHLTATGIPGKEKK